MTRQVAPGSTCICARHGVQVPIPCTGLYIQLTSMCTLVYITCLAHARNPCQLIHHRTKPDETSAKGCVADMHVNAHIPTSDKSVPRPLLLSYICSALPYVHTIESHPSAFARSVSAPATPFLPTSCELIVQQDTCHSILSLKHQGPLSVPQQVPRCPIPGLGVQGAVQKPSTAMETPAYEIAVKRAWLFASTSADGITVLQGMASFLYAGAALPLTSLPHTRTSKRVFPFP